MEITWFERFCDALLALGYDTPRDAGTEEHHVQRVVVPLFQRGLSPEDAAAELERSGDARCWGY